MFMAVIAVIAVLAVAAGFLGADKIFNSFNNSHIKCDYNVF